MEPAYAIHGDNFDWSATADHLTLYVSNGMGEGIEASLLTNLAVNALRDARRAGIPLGDQAALADQAVYARYRGRSHMSVLMFDFALTTGRARVVDAGSPQTLRLRDGVVERVAFDAQLPLGKFEDTGYVEQDVRIEPGDRLLFVSDGVYAVAPPQGEAHGDAAPARAIQHTRLLPAADVSSARCRRPVPPPEARHRPPTAGRRPAPVAPPRLCPPPHALPRHGCRQTPVESMPVGREVPCAVRVPVGATAQRALRSTLLRVRRAAGSR